MIFNPVELNAADLSHITSDLDPDVQFYNDVNMTNNLTNCMYHNETTFNHKVSDHALGKDTFSLAHLNIRSLPKNLTKFEQYAETLDMPFTVLGFTENWLYASNYELYNIPGYTHECLYRKKHERWWCIIIYQRYIEL